MFYLYVKKFLKFPSAEIEPSRITNTFYHSFYPFQVKREILKVKALLVSDRFYGERKGEELNDELAL